MKIHKFHKHHKKRKIFFLVLSLLIIILLILGTYALYPSIKKLLVKPKPAANPGVSVYVPDPNYNPPVPFFSNDPRLANMADDYVLPDFDKFESLVITEHLVKSLPKDGSIRLGFFHDVQDIRKWDKVYSITKGKIQTKNQKGDFDIWIHTDYVSMFDGTNMCEVITDARNKGELGQDTQLTEKEITWKYLSLIKYRKCFGI